MGGGNEGIAGGCWRRRKVQIEENSMIWSMVFDGGGYYGKSVHERNNG